MGRFTPAHDSRDGSLAADSAATQALDSPGEDTRKAGRQAARRYSSGTETRRRRIAGSRGLEAQQLGSNCPERAPTASISRGFPMSDGQGY